MGTISQNEEGVELANKQESVRFTGEDLKRALNDPNVIEFSRMGRDEKTRILSMDDEQRRNQKERDKMERAIEEKNKKNPPSYN